MLHFISGDQVAIDFADSTCLKIVTLINTKHSKARRQIRDVEHVRDAWTIVNENLADWCHAT
jgi:hypothetical protein